jgi:diguanylate cyclase (GGDEF)-like protein
MIKILLNKVHSILKKIESIKPIANVPIELKEQFDQFQLKNSISRIRILGALFVSAKISIIALFSKTNKILGDGIVIGVLDYTLLASFIFYNLSVYYYSHKNKNYRQLWAICYLSVFFYSIITLLGMVSTETYANAPAIVLPLLFFAVLLPDFNPKIFISFLVFLYITVAFILIYYSELNNDFLENRMFIFNMFIIVAVTKFALYNNKVHTYTYISKINELNKKLEALSTTDELTKLNNRRSFLEYMEITWKQSHRLNLPLTVLMIDIDYFKKYNDSLGHLEGDKALIAIAQCMKNYVKRETDFIARFGGEEFVCLLPFVAKDEAVNFAITLVESVENIKIPHPMSEHSKYVTISAGMASIVPNNNNSYTQLLDEADKALYTAKASGRNRIVVN